MNGNARVAMYRDGLTLPVMHIKYKQALDMEKRGAAEFIDERSIRITGKSQVVSSSKVLTSHQGHVYEAAGIEKFPQFVQGGLTRTEHQPAELSPFSGAKVGHQ